VRSADDCYLNIIGGVQPGKVAKLFRGGEIDGLTARYGLAVEPKPVAALWVDERPDYEARDKVKAFVAGMHKRTEPVEGVPFEQTLRLSGPAYAVASRWLEKTRKRAEESGGTNFGGHLAKYPALFLRLAIVFHFMKHGARAPDEVDEGTVFAVQQLVDKYLEPHARRLYAIIEDDHPARAGAEKIAEWIRESGNARIKEFTVREVYRKCWRVFSDSKDSRAAIVSAMELLDALGWIRLYEKPAVRGGRSSVVGVVNPKVFEG
jgi:hypothetical protein